MKVRNDILKVYLSLHTWVGICAGLLLFIGFFAGALTMFKEPLDGWTRAPAQRLPMVAHAQFDTLLAQLLAQHPQAGKGFTLNLEAADHVPAPVTWKDGGRSRAMNLSATQWQASLDEAGQLRTQSVQPSILGDLIDQLHRTGGVPFLLGDEYFGVYLMGVAGVLYFLALVSGLIVLLPTLVQDFFALRPGKNKKRFWLDAHNLVGLISLPFHVVISLSVIVFAFHDQFYDGLQHVVYGERPIFTPPAPKPRSGNELLPPTQLLKNLQESAPGFTVVQMEYSGLGSPRARVLAHLTHPGEVVHGPIAGYLVADPYSGEVTNRSMLPGGGNGFGTAVNTFFALHFGSFGGMPVRWLYFALGLSGAFLFYSGNLLWIEARRKRQKSGQPHAQQPRSTRLMAAGTVGVSLGSVLGVTLALVAGKWLQPHVGNINHGYVTVYYAAFLLAVAFAFWRGAARAAAPLLAACALACLAVPISSLIAALLPSLELWSHDSLASRAVDATGLVSGFVLLQAARWTRRRAQSAARDSVWSAATLAAS